MKPGEVRVVVRTDAYSHPLGPSFMLDASTEHKGSVCIYIGSYEVGHQSIAIVLTPNGLRDVEFNDFVFDTERLET